MVEIIVVTVFVCFCIGGGVTTLRTGRIKASNRSVVEGRPAQFIGWLLLSAIPVGIVSALVVWLILRSNGQAYSDEMFLLSASPILLFPLVAVAVGLATARPIQKTKRSGELGVERNHEPD
jgi:hypothetical protein